MVKGIPSDQHGWIDYSYVPMTLLAPSLIGFKDEKWAAGLCYVSSITTLGYSLLTDYKLGAARLIPYRTHALLDLGLGVATLGSIALNPPRGNKAKTTLLVMGLTSVLGGILSLIGSGKSR